jgi:hypothetical protein
MDHRSVKKISSVWIDRSKGADTFYDIEDGFSHAHTHGRCYDHNYLRFLPIFCEKFCVFLKNQFYDANFTKTCQQNFIPGHEFSYLDAK